MSMPIDGELIEYSRVDQMAAVYQDAIPKLFKAIDEVENQCERLRTAFAGQSYSFGIEIKSRCGSQDEDEIRAEFKRDAWAALIDKLGVRKYMPNAKRDELDRVLRGGGRGRPEADKFPEVDAEAIVTVLRAYVCNVDEFLTESVKEQFDFWCGRKWSDDYKTNRERYRISRKIVATWMVEQTYASGVRFRVIWDREKHVSGLDNIFHFLDGRGFPNEHKGNLVSAIEMAEGGAGTSTYFRFRAFKNRNLHLTCLRPDLLEMFNDIACDKAIPSQLRIERKTEQ